jgi:hypothetical protein
MHDNGGVSVGVAKVGRGCDRHGEDPRSMMNAAIVNLQLRMMGLTKTYARGK